MFHSKKNRIRLQTILWVLAVYLSVWIGSAQGLSLVSMLMDGSHQTFLSGRSDQIRLVFHHAGYQDEHEPSPGHPAGAKAGLLDRLLAAGTGDQPPPDHLFYLSDHAQEIPSASTAKPAPVFKTLSPSTTIQESVTFIPPVSNRPSPPPLKISTTLRSLRTTVLLI